MKLLLDEMHTPAAAEALRKDGFDVSAVAELEVRSLSDTELLAYAETGDQAVVTENVADFRLIATDWAALGRQHAGIMYTPSVRFPRCRSTYPRDLTAALRRFLESPPAVVETASWEWWLSADG